MRFLQPLRFFTSPACRCITYVQGQSPEPKIREYFYFIDHQGMLFLDDTKIKNFTSCFKEKKFLHFFFSRLRINETGRFEEEFPYLSPCGRERNFIRCDDRPVVFTHLVPGETGDFLLFGHAGDLLKVPFEPSSLCMYPASGRVYHSAPERSGGVGLVRSALAIEMSEKFRWSEGLQPESDHPDSFEWRGVRHELNNRLVKVLDSQDARFRTTH